MTDYEKYVKEINNIYSILEKIKGSWNDDNNMEFLKQVDSFKDDVLSCASLLEKKTKNSNEVNSK